MFFCTIVRRWLAHFGIFPPNVKAEQNAQNGTRLALGLIFAGFSCILFYAVLFRATVVLYTNSRLYITAKSFHKQVISTKTKQLYIAHVRCA
jgi:hypothetical protein